ncbi:MAG: alkaline phosphatase [Deltaproteobacteria bacterium]|nr:alkaline phosphatase [Deltaproteobacteria bacterium]
MKNRSFRLFVLLFAVTSLLSPSIVPAAQGRAQAKNVIIMIGDGMGPSQFGAAWIYSNRVLKKELHMSELINQGRTAYLVNDTADAIVTESAAAAGQIATGQRMTARALSMAADGKTPVKTILEMAKGRKMATGLVTTSGITDATPGAFAAHVARRSDEESVADQELKCGVDVLMGGRKQFFLPENAGGKRKDGRNLMEEAQKAGYTVAGTAEELKAAPAGKILGLFNMGNMSYEIDRSATAEPSLAEMAEKTLQLLSKSKNGFFAMIEAGRIDHAAHRNDAAATIREALAFDEAVGVAMDFVKKNPATLLIVTADHETAGMALVGHGKESKEYVGMDLKAIEKSKVSFESMAAKWGKKPTPEKIQEIVKQSMDIDLTDDEARTVADDAIKKLDPYNYNYDYLHSLAFVLRPYLRVGWGSQTHTASPLFLFGEGPGSQRIHGLMHNTEIFTVMKAALKLK